MTYGAATYGGTTLGSGMIVDADVTDRAPTRTLTRQVTLDARTLDRSIRTAERELML